jgi:hypothetical protein
VDGAVEGVALGDADRAAGGNASGDADEQPRQCTRSCGMGSTRSVHQAVQLEPSSAMHQVMRVE